MRNLDGQTAYPRLIRRIQAVLIDGVIMPVAAIAIMTGVGRMGYDGVFAASAAILTVFVLEPFLVTITGGTIGHHLLGIRVINSQTMLSLGIFRSTLRLLVKTTFGLFSLIVVLTSRKHQAIHDYISGSIVVIKNPNALPGYEVLEERDVEEDGYVYPTKVRRIAAIALYSMILFVVYLFIFALLMTKECINTNICSGYDQAVSVVSQLLWLVGTVVLIVLGWRGRLWGCRRKQKDVAGIS